MVALILLPVGIYLQLAFGNGRLFGVNHLVYILVAGVCLFCIGRIFQQYGNGQGG